jgi:hypothetical protein
MSCVSSAISVTIRVAPGAAPRVARSRRHPIRWAVPRSHAETFPGCRLRRDAEALRRRARRPVRRISSLVARASGDDRPDAVHDDDASAPSSSALLASVADARWFNTYLHGAVFVLILGFIDAGYSRDWTRIGAITPEFEQRLRDWAVILGWVHVAAAAAAGAVANARGLPVAPATAKTFLVGFLAFLEVCFKTVPEGEGGSESA